MARAEPIAIDSRTRTTQTSIPWRIIVGFLICLLAVTGLVRSRYRDGAVVVLILGGSLLTSGLPIRQPRWWAVNPGLIFLYEAFDVGVTSVGATAVFAGIVLGLTGVLSIAYGFWATAKGDSAKAGKSSDCGE